MKKRIWVTALAAALILSGCGGSDYASDTRVSENNSFTGADSAASESGGFADYDYAADISTEESWYPEAEPAEAPADNSGSTKGNEASSSSAADEIDREMLVYSCNMSIDTLDFASTIDGFRVLLNQYGGFIEYENYDDGGSYGRWYSDTSDKWQSYNATVRIPSRNYDAFCNSAGDLGDLRSKNASVQNLNSEYHDLSVSLEIYEAKEERYIALLAGVTEDEYAIAIERELTDLQVQIATIKSRMNKINTDVSYSYVYITINEVKEYVSEPVKTDTFFDRLLNTLSDTGRGFVEFLETLLFLIIRLLPYLVLIALLVLVILFLTRKRRARKRNLRQAQAAWSAAQAAAAQGAQNAPMMQNVQAAQTIQTPQASPLTAQNTQAVQATQEPQTATSTSQNTQAAPQTTQGAQAAQNTQGTQTTQEPQATAPTSQNTQAAQAIQNAQTSEDQNKMK